MTTHLTLKIRYSLEEIEKKIGRPLTNNEIYELERKLPDAIDGEMGNSLHDFIFDLINVWIE